MKMKLAMLIVMFVALVSVAPINSQHMGFRIGIAPPIIHGPIQPFVTSPVTTFGTFPSPFAPRFAVVQSPQVPVTISSIPNTFPTRNVLVPVYPSYPGTIIYPTGPIIYTGTPAIVHPPTKAFVDHHRGMKHPAPFHHRGLPQRGTTRAQVIAEWGAPTVSVLTSTGEQMRFADGTTIVLQNGVVAH